MQTMKKITILMLLIVSTTIAQEAEKEKTFKFAPQSRIYFIHAFTFGDNQFADAYGGNFGIGTNLSFFSVANFRQAINYEYAQYRISDPTRTGNVGTNSTYWTVFGSIAYEVPLTPEILIAPDIGIGYAQLRLKPGSTTYGEQAGIQYRVGFTTDYKIGSAASVFAGVHYIYTHLGVKTHPDFEEYYSQGQQVQLSVGFQLGKR
jgi:hypothetical protein